MEDYPRTLMEFESRFRTEEACWDYLVGMRWPDGFVCPKLPRPQIVANRAVVVPLCRLWAAGIGDSRYGLPGDSQAAAGLVSCHVVGHQPEKRCQVPKGFSKTSDWPATRPPGLGPAQAAAGDGSTEKRSSRRARGGR